VEGAKLPKISLAVIVAFTFLLVRPSMTLASTAATWNLQATVNPSPVQYPENWLSSVSCHSSVCFSVGNYEEDSTGIFDPMVQEWNGTTWALGSTPPVTGASSDSFSAISCTYANACTLVGSWLDASGSYWPLAERWNGTVWSVQAPVLPTGAANTNLTGVSCPKSTTGFDCEAIGSYSVNSVSQVLAEQWNGSYWAVQSVPAPAGSAFTGISCAAPTACVAVGYWQSSSNAFPLIERWNGTTWTVQPIETTNAGSLSGVGCPQVTACTAVGYIDQRSKGRPFGGPISEQWNGKTWTEELTPALGQHDRFFAGSFASVSCVTSVACEAVGGFGYGPLAEGWNGKTWSLQSAAAANSLTFFASISCTAATACTAVGQDAPDPDEEYINSFAERYA
jgi:hypothetical protein